MIKQYLNALLPHSLLNQVTHHVSKPVKVYVWRERIGTDLGGHIAIEVSGHYFSVWANSSPDVRKKGGKGKMYIIKNHQQDLQIVGQRQRLYRNGHKTLPDTKALLDNLKAEALDDSTLSAIKDEGRPDQVFTLYKLNTHCMHDYLQQVEREQATYQWNSLGKTDQGFNCTTVIEQALIRGGIEKLAPNYTHTLRQLGLLASTVSLLFLLSKRELPPITWSSLTYAITPIIAGGALGGYLDAQPLINAAFKAINTSKFGPQFTLIKLGIWLAGSVGSAAINALAGDLLLGDNLMNRLFTSPAKVAYMVGLAQANESAQYTLDAPRFSH